MILTRLENLSSYRTHAPKRAVVLTNGAGAAKHGRRAYRLCVAALYLALEIQMAVTEHQPALKLLPLG